MRCSCEKRGRRSHFIGKAKLTNKQQKRPVTLNCETREPNKYSPLCVCHYSRCKRQLLYSLFDRFALHLISSLAYTRTARNKNKKNRKQEFLACLLTCLFVLNESVISCQKYRPSDGDSNRHCEWLYASVEKGPPTLYTTTSSSTSSSSPKAFLCSLSLVYWFRETSFQTRWFEIVRNIQW